VLHAFNRAWNTHQVISEFKVGTDFRSDFFDSQRTQARGWRRSSNLNHRTHACTNRDAVPTRALQIAKRQIAEWRHFVERFEPLLRHQFAALLRNRNECSWCSVAASSGLRFALGVLLSRRDWAESSTLA
jgi:hypothetical protein